MAKRGYRATRRGSLYCPLCLTEDTTPHLRLTWRLSFLTACPQHGTLLLDACPACQHPFAPHLNDLGPGRNWYFESDLPFEWCPQCGEHLAAQPPQATPQVLGLERRMLRGLVCDHMEWDGLGEVPASEGFDVLHQLLYVLFQPAVRATLDFLPDAPTYPARRNRSFEDFDLEGRQALMGRLASLVHDWSHRFTDLMRQAGMTRRPLVYNMPTRPVWYDLVAEQFSQANGRRAYKQVPLVPWLTLAELAHRRDTAPTACERQRWDILWHYAQRPEKVPVARQLGVDWQLVHRTVTRYNETGPEALAVPTRGRSNRKKRLLTEAQEQELQAWLSAAERRNNEEMRDWFEARTGRRPDGTTLWIYRRGMGDHSRAGRRAS